MTQKDIIEIKGRIGRLNARVQDLLSCDPNEISETEVFNEVTPLINEIATLAAMCVRMLENLPGEKQTGRKYSDLYRE